MCGKNSQALSQAPCQLGSPPRVREKLPCLLCQNRLSRITPACAGKTRIVGLPNLQDEDHPRVCGKNVWTKAYSPQTPGSPPRVREKPMVDFPKSGLFGITPACAGKTPNSSQLVLGWRDHPRVCGKNVLFWFVVAQGLGSPPRVREKH